MYCTAGAWVSMPSTLRQVSVSRTSPSAAFSKEFAQRDRESRLVVATTYCTPCRYRRSAATVQQQAAGPSGGHSDCCAGPQLSNRRTTPLQKLARAGELKLKSCSHAARSDPIRNLMKPTQMTKSQASGVGASQRGKACWRAVHLCKGCKRKDALP